jgi:hypothetical protein
MKGDVGMKISVMDRIQAIRDAAAQAENFALARELGEIQLEIIDERSREWANGYDAGVALAKRDRELRLGRKPK